VTDLQRAPERARKTTVRLLRSPVVREWHQGLETRERRAQRMQALSDPSLDASGSEGLSRTWIVIALVAIVTSLVLWWVLEGS